MTMIWNNNLTVDHKKSKQEENYGRFMYKNGKQKKKKGNEILWKAFLCDINGGVPN